MKSPFTGKEMTVIKEWRKMSYRKEEFKVLFHVYKCDDTGEQFEDENFATLNYNQLTNQYREKYTIPFPEQIISIRKKYGLSASKMSEILGFGINSYRQYEAGEVPSQSNAKLIQLAEDPDEFRKLVFYCNTLEDKDRHKINRTLDNLLVEQKQHEFEKQLEKYLFGTGIPNSYTGYKTPNLERFSHMVLFFSEKFKPWKTMLNKLLFYSDFKMFHNTGYSISGVQYYALPMGPVPNNFNSIFEYMCNNKLVDIYYNNFSDGGTGEQFKPGNSVKFNPVLFTQQELKVLDEISVRFKNTTTGEIIDLSHKEKAWIDNISGKKMIDYRYGFEID